MFKQSPKGVTAEQGNMFVFPHLRGRDVFDILYPHNRLNSHHRNIIATFADVAIPYDRAV